MKKESKRLLALLLVLMMVVSALPTMAFAAEETATWAKVDLADIQPTDTIAITMYAPATNKNYVLKNNGGTQTYGPAAVWDAANVTDSTWQWNVKKVNDGYEIYPAGTTSTWLYCINHNNGLRVGNGEAVTVWSLDSSGYLKCSDTGNNTRYMGVYDNNGGNTSGITPNFRTYKNTTGNTKNQTLTFYKLSNGGEPVPEKVATPVITAAEPDENGAIAVTITCATAGAAIHYTTDGTVPTTESAVYENAITVTPSAETPSVTVKAIAVMDGMTDSAVAEATYKYSAPVVKTAEKMTELPKDGDTIIIYNSGNAMGKEPNGKKLSGVAAELDGTKLPVSDEMAQLLVKVEDGKFIFTLDGKYLTSAEKGNGLSFTDTLTDCGKWTAEAAEGSWYLKNVGANYNGNYNQAMEYYNGFTTYGIKETEIYQMQLFLVSQAGVLANGDKVVIYNPSSGMAMSSEATGTYYRAGVAVTPNADGTVNAASALIWDVTVNADGTYTFSHNGDKLSMNDSKNSLPLNEVNNTWEVREASTENCYYLINANRSDYYVEWYEKYTEFTTYKYSAANEAVYALQFLKVAEGGQTDELPAEGDQVVIYNLKAKGVLALQDDNVESPSITNAAAALADGKATVENGGLVFTVEKNGGYYRFKNESYGYLCSNGTGNNAFYSETASEDADWTLAVQGSGYTMESRTAKFQGKYSQFLEYYAGAYKTYSMYNATDYDIYTFQFYPCANAADVTAGVVNKPVVSFNAPAANVGQDYTLTFTVDAVFGVKDLTVKLGTDTLEAKLENGVYTVTIPAEKVTGEKLTVAVTGTDNKDVAINGSIEIAVNDLPLITDVQPASGSQTGDNKSPVISAKIGNAGENPTVVMTVNGEAVDAEYNAAEGTVAYITSNMADGRVNVTVTVTRADGKTASKSWSFTVGEATEQLYFGQLHSHTQYSDGSGTLDSALDYVAGLPESANVDFVAFTDHSNYFDEKSNANPEGALYDMTKATANSQKLWSEYKGKMAEFNASQSDVVALGGFEMTWSGGPGHINTWNTPGIVSRNNNTLNNKTADAGMKAYYALLSQPEGANSINQFNHPGTTFGNFQDFAYWDALIDTRMHLVEVGNGEGAIGAGGYYPSYEQYTMALDKGWHLAPTNNQDNHKGKWGNANDARDVILTDDLSEQGLYEGIRNYRVYATEDKNLELYYTVNGMQMGSIIEEVPEKLDINVQVSDPDTSDSISKVEVIVNSGRVAHTWNDQAELATGSLTCTLDPTYSYYYIRVTEGDGDLAVTAPVWVGEALKLGISSVECGTATPVTGEELTLTTTLFNSETNDATVKSVTYTSGNETLGTDTTGYTVPGSGGKTITFNYTPTVAKVMTVKVTVVMELDGQEYEFSMDVTLDVLNADDLVYIGIDASHYNEYVAGNYKDSMGNFGSLAAGYSVRTVQLNTSEELIAACNNESGKYKMIILTAPSRRDDSALRDPYANYTDTEIEALVKFSKAGGSLVFTGWSDYYEHYATFPAEDHMAAQQNKVLEALGSSLRISDDGTNDDALNGGQPQRLYFSTYNFDSFLMDGVEFDPENPNNNMYSQLFSHYGGASIYVTGSEIPATVTPVVYGHATTYSKDSDSDGLGGNAPKYEVAEGDSRLMMLATEKLDGQGLIVVSGAAFMSNFEVQAQIGDSNAEKNYSNYNICENLVKYLNPVQITDIAEVQKQTEEGYKYTIEGVVTSNASGYDKATAFFDCIYVQDETGGVCCFPVAGDYKIGDKVRITGTTDFYQGEMELQVTAITKIGEGTVTPKEVTAAQINDRSVLGQLITLKGSVVSFEEANGLIQTIMVKDAAGNVARVFIDGYITTDEDVKNLTVGCNITVTGLASYDDTFNAPEGPFPRIRIRNRADVVCTPGTTPVDPVDPVKPVWPVRPSTPAPTRPVTGMPYTDVATRDWFYSDVAYVHENGIMNGTGAYTFGPYLDLTRGMIVTMLYRMEKEPAVAFKGVFNDVVKGEWYADAVEWASANEIVTGYGNGKFGPNDPVTREQLSAILYRYAVYQGMTAVNLAENLTGFHDANTVSSYAVQAMNWAVGEGLINGSNGKLRPQDHATRAEVAAIIHRFLTK